MPARNPPRASDRPTACVAHAAPTATISVASVNSSVLRARPISWNSGRTSQRRNVSTSARATAACRIDSTISHVSRSGPLPASALSSASNGTNARSWNSRMPIAMRLCVRFSSACSPSWRITIAVDDMASAPPIITAVRGGTLSPHSTTANAAVVSETCRPPMRNASRRMAIMRGSENSSPSVNTRNTTPSSARIGATPPAVKSSAYGPSSMPTAR